MGGCTLTVYGDTLDEVLKIIKKRIFEGFESCGMSADGDVAVLNPSIREAHVFRVVYLDREAESPEVELFEIQEGRNVDVALRVSAAFKPEPKAWVGTVHLHT